MSYPYIYSLYLLQTISVKETVIKACFFRFLTFHSINGKQGIDLEHEKTKETKSTKNKFIIFSCLFSFPRSAWERGSDAPRPPVKRVWNPFND